MQTDEPILRLDPKTYEDLLAYAQILKVPPEALAEQALAAFFAEMSRQMGEKNPLDDNAQTNLSYDEFWDGVDLE